MPTRLTSALHGEQQYSSYGLHWGTPWRAVVPALFISFGDAITGVVRNAVFGRRTKH